MSGDANTQSGDANAQQITVRKIERGIYAAHGPCEECPKEGYGTSKTHAKENMRHICRVCREMV